MDGKRETICLEYPDDPPDATEQEQIQEGRAWAQSLLPPRPEQIRRELALLESIQRRPQMHFGNAPPSEVHARFEMLHWGFYCAGFQTGTPRQFDIARERGWEIRSTGYWTDMEEQGYSHAEMVRETLEIEIEAWRRLLAKTKQEGSTHE